MRLLLIVQVVGACCLARVSADDWYRYRGPKLDGVSSETDWNDRWPATGPPVKWTAAVGTGFSSVVISQGKLYTIGNEENVDTVRCFDCDGGKELWSHSYTCPTDPNEFEGGPTSTPTVDQDHVFTLGRRGDLFCFDKVTGNVVWEINVAQVADVRIPAWGFAGSPLVIEDKLILNVGDAGVAVDKKTGRLIWKSEDKDSGYSTAVPIPGDPSRVVLGSARSYVCVQVDDGKEVWRQRWLTTFGCNAADAIISDNHLFLSSGYNRGCALLRFDGSEIDLIWKNKEMQNQISSSLPIDGAVYGIHGDVANDARLRCLDLKTGEVRWTFDEVRAGAVSAAGGRLILVSDEGEVLIGDVSDQSFTPTARFQAIDEKCWTSPVLSGGYLYVRGADGTLVCFAMRH